MYTPWTRIALKANRLKVGAHHYDIDAIQGSLRQNEVDALQAILIPIAWGALDGRIAQVIAILEAEDPHEADSLLGHHLQACHMTGCLACMSHSRALHGNPSPLTTDSLAN